jgi:hypothetical protein
MEERISNWMYYKSGARVERDDKKIPGYSSLRNAQLDEAVFKIRRPGVLTKIYAVNGIKNEKNVTWYQIIYKTKIKSKEIGPSKWLVTVVARLPKSKEKTVIARELVMARSVAEVKALYESQPKWKRDKRFIITFQVSRPGHERI